MDVNGFFDCGLSTRYCSDREAGINAHTVLERARHRWVDDEMAGGRDGAKRMHDLVCGRAWGKVDQRRLCRSGRTVVVRDRSELVKAELHGWRCGTDWVAGLGPRKVTVRKFGSSSKFPSPRPNISKDNIYRNLNVQVTIQEFVDEVQSK